MMRVIRLLLLPLLLLAGSADARLTIEITGGRESAMPIAVVPFANEALSEDRISQIVAADLARSGHFAPLPTEKLPARPHSGRGINFSAWRKAGVEHMVVGQLVNAGAALEVQFQLFDVIQGKQLAGYSVPTRPSRLRRVAHQISDLVYEQITGRRGAFNTHVAYVKVAEEEGRRVHRLAVADADGFNEQIILTSKHPLMSPAWSPDGERLAYVSFEGGRSELYIQNVASGEREKLTSYQGLNSAPSFSPDGKRLAMTLSRDGNPEIYILHLSSGTLTRATFSRAIDTEPAWAPDGRSLVFTSDRGGRPQIYRLALDNFRPQGRPQRLTFEGDYNARASFSPDGRRLVMVNGEGGRFRIAVQDLESGTLRVLTDNSLDESPSFAPNGSMVIYATERDNRGVLEAVSVDGSAQQRLGSSQGGVREPAWSPFISQ
ncbi:MAG: Tol-Pal system beta propeller repeat protein TolB [Pseudomonadota bacterium]